VSATQQDSASDADYYAAEMVRICREQGIPEEPPEHLREAVAALLATAPPPLVTAPVKD
jgi:hypothetical protein